MVPKEENAPGSSGEVRELCQDLYVPFDEDSKPFTPRRIWGDDDKSI